MFSYVVRLLVMLGMVVWFSSVVAPEVEEILERAHAAITVRR